MFKKSMISLALASCFMPLTYVQAFDEVIHQGLDDKTEVVVVIGKVPRKVQDVVGAVSVISSEVIDRQLVHNVADLLRYEAGINVVNSGNRFGNSSIAIRGISGNRIATEIDGVPVAEQFNVGSYSNSGRNYVDPELIKQVEILRGPASSTYGSDAIGGTINLQTKSATFFDEKFDQFFIHGSESLRYATAELYAEIEDFKGCLTYYRWFSKNFPDDGAFPETFLIWTKALFTQGKLKEAHRKAIETALTNIYLIPFLLDLEMKDQNLPGYLSSMGADYADQAIPHFKYLMTPEFSEWLYNAYKSKE